MPAAVVALPHRLLRLQLGSPLARLAIFLQRLPTPLLSRAAEEPTSASESGIEPAVSMQRRRSLSHKGRLPVPSRCLPRRNMLWPLPSRQAITVAAKRMSSAHVKTPCLVSLAIRECLLA